MEDTMKATVVRYQATPDRADANQQADRFYVLAVVTGATIVGGYL